MLNSARPVALGDALPSLESLLISGGDERIALNHDGLNKYLCTPHPDPTLLSFGSATAQPVSVGAFVEAEMLRQRWLAELSCKSAREVYLTDLGRLRGRLSQLLNLEQGDCVLLAASGTDIHELAVSLSAHPTCHVIAVQACETGSGVPERLSRHGRLHMVSIRDRDGYTRSLVEIESEIETLASQLLAAGEHVLLVSVDLSKSGLCAPSAAFAARLRASDPERVSVLIDACQLRFGMAQLRAYLQSGFMVAITGSKFIGGPSFSGALLLPGHMDHSGADEFGEVNFGMLLRWQSALYELSCFRSLPESKVHDFVAAFGAAVAERLRVDPHFEPLDSLPLSRPDPHGWDVMPTIFPFLVHSSQGALLTHSQSHWLYRALQQDLSLLPVLKQHSALASQRVQFGQPVASGLRDGVEVAALRLCLGARTITEGHVDQAIGQAMQALDKCVLLADCIDTLSVR